MGGTEARTGDPQLVEFALSALTFVSKAPKREKRRCEVLDEEDLMPTEVQDSGAPASARPRAKRGTQAVRNHWNGPVRTILFDKDRVDHLDELPERPEKLNGSKLLWVDIDRRDGETGDIGYAFELDDATCERLASSSEHPVFHDFDRYIHVTTYSPSEDEE